MKKRLQKCLNGQVKAIFARSPKTRIFLKSARGNQEKFFKNRPKSSPRLNGPNSTLVKIELSSKLYAFKVQRLENIAVQTAAQKVPEWPSYGNFREVIQNPHFLKKRNFPKVFRKFPNGQVMAIFARSPKTRIF